VQTVLNTEPQMPHRRNSKNQSRDGRFCAPKNTTTWEYRSMRYRVLALQRLLQKVGCEMKSTKKWESSDWVLQRAKRLAISTQRATISYSVYCVRCKVTGPVDRNWLSAVAMAVSQGWEARRKTESIYVTDHDETFWLCPLCSKGGAK
jgi:hypothetical protein